MFEQVLHAGLIIKLNIQRMLIKWPLVVTLKSHLSNTKQDELAMYSVWVSSELIRNVGRCDCVDGVWLHIWSFDMIEHLCT